LEINQLVIKAVFC